MFCPQPLLQLHELPSHVVPECAACLEKQSGQTAPPFKILRRRGSYLSPSRLPLTVCPPLPRPGLSLVIYIGGRALMESWIPPQASLQVMRFLCGSAWFQQCQNAGTCLFRQGQTQRNNVVPIWFRAVPTMMTWILPQTSIEIAWFLCGSTWFQQCRSARFAASYKTLLGLLWTRYWMLTARSQKEDK